MRRGEPVSWRYVLDTPAALLIVIRCRVAAKVVTGSLQGVLRVFGPKEPEYSPDDLLLEENLGIPILQVEIGRFVSYVSSSPTCATAPSHAPGFTVVFLPTRWQYCIQLL